MRLLEEPCVVYSFGASPGAMFEKEMAAQTGCEVFVFDDSIETLRHGKKTRERGMKEPKEPDLLTLSSSHI